MISHRRTGELRICKIISITILKHNYNYEYNIFQVIFVVEIFHRTYQ